MEQATNSFSKGLLLDTHPMVQGNDTLSDCLNGTLITMNGNEIILLNDMGNRRVNKAFLPSGYLPVGVKEYGGIIYVASYNPITNKSLIGSFPSPLKKIDLSKELGTAEVTINGSNFEYLINSVEAENLNGIHVLVNDSMLIPLTDDISLRAGDKFVIYCDNLSLFEEYLTNYNQIQGTKAESPKNRKYTILVGILNSLNEFVDITKTLCRWNANEEIIDFDESVSDIYKFNCGYFIPDSFDNENLQETINDSNFIISRLVIEANTYAYKLVGPMYLKISLNHIESFNYNIYGIYDKNVATLWIEGFLTYNCPDNVSNIESFGDDNYDSYETGNPGFRAFSLIDELGEAINETNDEINKPKPTSVYNLSNNTYTVKIIKKYTNIHPNVSNTTKYKYVIGVEALNEVINGHTLYLRDLSVNGELDLGLLGTGKVSIKGWRFYNNLNTKSTILTFSFDAYPEYGLKFGNLRFHFHDISKDNGNDDFIYPKNGMSLYNGRQTITIDWNNEDIQFESRKVYQVSAIYDTFDSNTNVLVKSNTIASDPVTPVQEGQEEDEIGYYDSNRWFITTELFNEFYSPQVGIDDFCNVSEIEHPEFYDKMKIETSVNGKIINNSKPGELNYIGGLTKVELNPNSSHAPSSGIIHDIEWKIEHLYKVNLLVDPTSSIEIVNEELYPDFVKVNELYKNKIYIDTVKRKVGTGEETIIQNLQNLTSDTTANNDFKNSLEFINKNDYELYDSIILFEEEDRIIDNTSITETINYCDVYVGDSNNHKVANLTNAFDCLSKIISDSSPLQNRADKCGIVSNFDHMDNTGDHHILSVVRGYNGVIDELPNDSDEPNGWVNLDFIKSNEYQTLKVTNSNVKEDLYNCFNKGTLDGLLFTYLGVKTSVNKINNSGKYINSSSISGNYYYRVWWKTVNNEWALFFKGIDNGNIITGSSFQEWISLQIKKDYIYCMWDIYNGSELEIYSAKDYFIYNKQYSIPETFIINYKPLDEISLSDILENVLVDNNDNPISIGTLKFKSDDEISNTNPSEVVINLNSSQEFLDTVNNFDPDNISNIEISTGAMLDSNNAPLNINNIYYKDNNNKLVKVNNFLLAPSRDIKNNGRNLLLYNGATFGSPEYKYNVAKGGDDETRTVIDFSGIKMVDGV